MERSQEGYKPIRSFESYNKFKFCNLAFDLPRYLGSKEGYLPITAFALEAQDPQRRTAV